MNTVKTPYGDVGVGDVYRPADGAKTNVVVTDVDTYAEMGDVVVTYPDKTSWRMDYFKLYCKYKKSKYMILAQSALVFFAIFISDLFWVRCVKSVNQDEPLWAGIWAVGIFLPTALGTVAYIANPWLLIPACLGHFVGTAFMVWWNKKQQLT